MLSNDNFSVFVFGIVPLLDNSLVFFPKLMIMFLFLLDLNSIVLMLFFIFFL